MSKIFDAIVVGLGAMGSAAAYQLSLTSKKVFGIDRYAPPHAFGSSHGDTRITRQAIGEGLHYVPLVMRSHQIWREIEAKYTQELFTECGGLIFAPQSSRSYMHGSDDFFGQTVDAATQFNIEHEMLDVNELQKRYPQFRYQGTEIGYYEPGAGFVRPEKCIEAQLQLAQENGVECQFHQEVIDIRPNSNGGAMVQTASAVFEADTVIICAGAWLPRLLPQSICHYFNVYRQVLYWFEPELNPDLYADTQLPIYICLGETEKETFYGFPAVQGLSSGIKVAFEQSVIPCTPDTINREVSPEEIESMYAQVSQSLKVKNNCLKSVACMYTVTPDYGFVIDRLPGHPQIILASPCSGHGFKHSAAIGQVLKELAVDEKTSFDLSAFSLSRFGVV